MSLIRTKLLISHRNITKLVLSTHFATTVNLGNYYIILQSHQLI